MKNVTNEEIVMNNYRFDDSPVEETEQEIFCIELSDETDDSILTRYTGDHDHIVVPENVTHIKNGAIRLCGARKLTIPKSVTKIDDIGICMMYALEEIIVDPENPRYESRNGCLVDKTTRTLLFGGKNATIPDDGSVTTITRGALHQYTCKDLVIPESVTCIEQGAISSASSGFESITVHKQNPVYHSAGNCLIHTESKVLVMGCNNSVIPDDGSVTVIGEHAFSDSSAITQIHIPGSIKVIECGAFLGMEQLEKLTFEENLLEIGDWAFCHCDKLTDVQFPDSLEKLGCDAFGSCDGLTELVLPKNLKEFNPSVFKYCFNLKKISVDPENKQFHSKDNCVIQTAQKKLVCACGVCRIPDDGSVVAIDEEAVLGYGHLEELIIPDSVTEIGAYAFYDCWNLDRIRLPEKLTAIRRMTFAKCDSLQFVTLPENVDTIEEQAFYESGLVRLEVPCKVTNIDECAFDSISDQLTICAPAGSRAEQYAKEHNIEFIAR